MEEGREMEDDVNEINTTLLGLQQAFAAAMRQSGVMGKVRAQLRAAAVAVVRADPCLRDTALGRVLQPAEMSLEGRVALLLIEDFLRAHGLRLAGGVFEEECNIGMIGEVERSIVEQQRQYQSGQGAQHGSVLEALLADVMDSQQAGQQKQQHQSRNLGPLAQALPRSAQPAGPPPAGGTSTARTARRQKVKPVAELCVPLELQGRREVTAWLKEYEDSVDFSDSSLESMASVDEQAYDCVLQL